jgi:hypothetical protein
MGAMGATLASLTPGRSDSGSTDRVGSPSSTTVISTSSTSGVGVAVASPVAVEVISGVGLISAVEAVEAVVRMSGVGVAVGSVVVMSGMGVEDLDIVLLLLVVGAGEDSMRSMLCAAGDAGGAAAFAVGFVAAADLVAGVGFAGADFAADFAEADFAAAAFAVAGVSCDEDFDAVFAEAVFSCEDACDENFAGVEDLD